MDNATYNKNNGLLTGKKNANKPKKIASGDVNLSPRRKINGFGMNDIGSTSPAFAPPLEGSNTALASQKTGPSGIRERTSSRSHGKVLNVRDNLNDI